MDHCTRVRAAEACGVCLALIPWCLALIPWCLALIAWWIIWWSQVIKHFARAPSLNPGDLNGAERIWRFGLVLQMLYVFGYVVKKQLVSFLVKHVGSVFGCAVYCFLLLVGGLSAPTFCVFFWWDYLLNKEKIMRNQETLGIDSNTPWYQVFFYTVSWYYKLFFAAGVLCGVLWFVAYLATPCVTAIQQAAAPTQATMPASQDVVSEIGVEIPTHGVELEQAGGKQVGSDPDVGAPSAQGGLIVCFEAVEASAGMVAAPTQEAMPAIEGAASERAVEIPAHGAEPEQAREALHKQQVGSDPDLGVPSALGVVTIGFV